MQGQRREKGEKVVKRKYIKNSKNYGLLAFFQS